MKKVLSAVMSAVLLATSLVAFTPTADAQQRYSRGDRERYVSRYCDRNPRDRDCRDFRRNRGRWDDARYRRWYRDRYRVNPGEAAAAAIFGFAAGAIAAGAAGAAEADHRARCEARYRSYDWRTDTYLASDGYRYRCRL